MATGHVLLFPGGIAPDGSGSGNNTAALSYEVSGATQTSNTPKVTFLKLLFDGVTDEHWLFSFLLPSDYSSGGTLRGTVKFTSATTGNAIMKASQATTTDDSTDDDALVFIAAAVSASIAADATQGQTTAFTVALTTTNMSSNRKIVIFIGRDPDNASDTITTDLELLVLSFEYTTT